MQSERKLEVRHVSKSSVLKNGFIFAILLSIATLAVLSGLYLLLDQLGILASVNSMANDLIKFSVTFTHVLWLSAGLAVLNIVFIPLLLVLAASVYNLCASLFGGVRMNFTEKSTDISSV